MKQETTSPKCYSFKKSYKFWVLLTVIFFGTIFFIEFFGSRLNLSEQAINEQLLKDNKTNFSIAEIKDIDFGDGGKSKVVALTPKKNGVSSSTVPLQVWIYEKDGFKYKLATKIAPSFSSENLSKASFNFLSMEPFFVSPSSQAVLIKLGITEADFWGVFPIIIAKTNGQYNFMQSFPDQLKDSKEFSQKFQTSTLEIYDALNKDRKVKTIGTYNYLTKRNDLVAIFRGTLNCKTCPNPSRVEFYKTSGNKIVYDDRGKEVYYLNEKEDPDKFLESLAFK